MTSSITFVCKIFCDTCVGRAQQAGIFHAQVEPNVDIGSNESAQECMVLEDREEAQVETIHVGEESGLLPRTLGVDEHIKLVEKVGK